MELAKRGKGEGGLAVWCWGSFPKVGCVQVGRSRGDRNQEKNRIHLGNKQYG